MAHRNLLTLGIWLSAFSASFLFLKNLPGPYIWIFLVWSLTFLWTVIVSHGTFFRIFFCNLAAMFFILSIAEAYCAYDQNVSDIENMYTLEHVWDSHGDPLMGYVPIPDTQRTARKLYKGNLSYQVTISINNHGYRIAPPYAPRHLTQSQSILFFGGSYSFGEAVNDHETMPYVTGLLTDGKYKIFNFAVHGYGPQHMLAAIEHEIVDAVVDIQPRYIIYQAIVDHVGRVAGHQRWLDRGPQYILGEAGEVTYSGSFMQCKPSHENCLTKRIHRNLKKSFLLQRIWFHRISADDIDLFLKVVDRSRQLLAEKYPDAEFHVIFWDQPWNPVSHKILEDLKQRPFGVHLIKDIIPDIHENHGELYSVKYDGHPNATAHRKLAQYVVRNIINSSRSIEDPLNLSDSLTVNTP